jgi:uncharacterized RDD family membrane protein YckC
MDASNPYAPPQSAVHDVPVQSDRVELADISTRFAAYIVDGIVVVLLTYVPLVAVIGAGGGGFDGAREAVEIAAVLVMLAGLGVWIWFTVLYVARNGQSIGKKLLNIKVVRGDGSRASLARIFWLRNVVNVLIGIIPVYPLVDHLFIFGASRQCLHDKIADTIVVKT